MKKVAIIGFGRIGQLLAEILQEEFDLTIIEKSSEGRQRAKDAHLRTGVLEDIEQSTYIYLAVPISHLSELLTEINPLVGPEQVVIDVCSAIKSGGDLWHGLNTANAASFTKIGGK